MVKISGTDIDTHCNIYLFCTVDTLHVLRGDVGAQQSFPSILSVALQNLPLKVGAHWTNFISPERERERETKQSKRREEGESKNSQRTDIFSK